MFQSIFLAGFKVQGMDFLFNRLRFFFFNAWSFKICSGFFFLRSLPVFFTRLPGGLLGGTTIDSWFIHVVRISLRRISYKPSFEFHEICSRKHLKASHLQQNLFYRKNFDFDINSAFSGENSSEPLSKISLSSCGKYILHDIQM